MGAANNVEAALAKAQDTGDFALFKHYEKELAFQLSNHRLHGIDCATLGGKAASHGRPLEGAVDGVRFVRRVEGAAELVVPRR